MNDSYNSYGPPQYEQNYHYGGRGGYDNSYGPPPERRYPPRHGHGGYDNPRYNNESRGPRQPYNSERYNNDSQNPSGPGYRGDRSERPMGQGPGQMSEDKPGRMMGEPMNSDSRGKHPEGRRYNDHSEMRRDDGENRGQERSERPRYNQPRDDGENNFRGGYNPGMRGGPSYGGGGGYRGRGGPRGDFRGGGFSGGPHRDNDPEGGRSRFNGGYDSFRGEGGPGMRGVRGNLRGGRGGRGGMYRDNDGEGSGPMHRISERGGFNRDDDRGGFNSRGMPPYRGRG
jgi:hypothetical protein